MVKEQGDPERESRLRKETILTSGQTMAVVLPEEGVLVARFRVGGIDVFFPDQLVFSNGRSKRRGGVQFFFLTRGL